MILNPRFLFDECIGEPIMLSLREQIKIDAQFEYIPSKFHAGINDKDWVPKIAEERDWIVITGDSGRQSKKGNRLPTLCLEAGVQHIVLSSSIQCMKMREKATLIAFAWPQIVRVAESDIVGHRLIVRQTKGGNVVVAITRFHGC